MRWIVLTKTLLALAAAIGIGYHVYVIAAQGQAFVHPDFHDNILQEAVVNGTSFHVSDVLLSMQPRAPGEFRPRFLTYAILTVDQKLRIILHDILFFPPSFAPVEWLVQLLLGPFLLLRLLVNLTSDRRAAFSAVVIYLTSIGSLSGVALLFMPGKVWSGLVFVAALHLATLTRKRLKDTPALLYEAPGWEKYGLLLVIFAGCFLDELALFTFVLVPVLFPELFLPHGMPLRRLFRGKLRRPVANSLFYGIPAIVFLVVVLAITPYVWRTNFGRDFEYLQNTLAIGKYTYGAKSIFVGPNGVFGPAQIYDNLMTLFGMSLVPHQVSAFVQSPFGAYPGTQVTNLPKFVILGVFFGGIGYIAWSASGPTVVYLRRALLAMALFLVFLCLVMIRQFPIVTGYYYGAPFAVMFALLAGLTVACVRDWQPAWQTAAAAAVLLISMVQIDNFIPVHAGWRYTHNELVIRPRYEKQFKLNNKPVTWEELKAIRAAWLRGELKRYIAENEVSTGSVYLIHELRTIDRVRQTNQKSK